VIRFDQRVLAVGMNGSGKSELARYLTSQIRVRRVLIDPKREWSLGVNVPPIRFAGRTLDEYRRQLDTIDVAALPFLHVQPKWRDRDQLTALFDWLDGLPGQLWVWIDEAFGVSSAAWAPDGLLSLVVAGRARGRGLIACTQRPRNIATEFKTEANHLFLFPPVDLEDVGECLRGAAFLPPARAVELMDGLPEHGYLWVDKIGKGAAIGDPLPAHARTATAGIDRAA
jgi:hypothetical protein